MNSKTPFLITLPDYKRAFQLIYSLLKNENTNTSRACLYFGFMGSAILRLHHNLPAKPAVGKAIYKLDGTNDVLALACENPDGSVDASLDGFHCWIEVDGWVIDLSAPLFTEMFKIAGYEKEIPRRMMQKRKTDLKSSVADLNDPGDVVLEADSVLTQYFADRQEQHAMNKDLEDIAVKWYRPTPKRIAPQIQIVNQHGEMVSLRLSTISVSGKW